MKTSVSGSVLGAIAAAAMLLPFAAVPAAAQTPGRSYLQSCRDVQVRGDRLTATCRTQEGRWNRTSIGGIGQCAGGVANSDGRLVCGRQGGGFNAGTQRARGREFGRRGEHERRGREHGWRGGPEYGWGPGYYGR
ncbi:MAG TPA: CVNH domain-containing protein [Stellaceae bacterium]|nr:CVNH domain-containing protein [Stellaceae bacterium]